MKKIALAAGTAATLALPMLALAANNPQLSGVTDLVESIGNIINMLLPITFALALLYFFWGLAKYILSSGDDEERTKGKHIMIWGIVALFVMASVFGIIRFIQNAFDIDANNNGIQIPNVEIRN